MTLRDLLSAYAPEILLNIVIYDKGTSAYCLRLNSRTQPGHDYEIFETYSDAMVLEWYVVNGMVNVLLDIEKF